MEEERRKKKEIYGANTSSPSPLQPSTRSWVLDPILHRDGGGGDQHQNSLSLASKPLLCCPFGGRCILYGSVGYNGTLSLLSSSPPSLCYFISAVSGLTAIFTLVSLLRCLYSLCYGDGVHSWIRTSLVVSATCLFFLLVSACVLRVGMDVLCGSIQKSKAAASCPEAQQRPWTPPHHPGKFYDNLYAAQVSGFLNSSPGTWSGLPFVLWVWDPHPHSPLGGGKRGGFSWPVEG
uniref:Transmembrane protein 179B n=1 Tax=Pseudonaja textilis TaxID=8673 RepID=A0A670ZHK1_PSETE